MEAVIELKWKQSPTTAQPQTPREAIEILFDIPDGNARLLTEEDARHLASEVELILRGQKEKPTVIIRDRGIGLHPNDFDKSIVSLGQSDKGERPYLIGMYGQGGSSAFEKSEYTVIVSRRHPDHLDGHDDLAGWTIVRRHLTTRINRYSYLVDPSTNKVPFFAGSIADGLDLPYGTHVAHVQYRNLGSFASQLITNNAYYTLNYRLFDPLIPWTLREDRSMVQKAARTMRGVPHRLQQLPATTGAGLPSGATRGGDTSIRHSIDFIYPDPTYGNIRVEWWILQDEAIENGRRRGVHRNTVQPYRDRQRRYSRRRIAITRGGQTHAALTPHIFELQKLRQVSGSIVVHVGTDELSFEAGASFFASNRADLKTESQEAVERAITAAIETYRDELRAVERERQAEIVQGRGAADETALRRRLDRIIRAFHQNLPGSRGGSTERSGRQDEFTGRAVPTYLRFANHNELGMRPGIPTRTDLLTDASDATITDSRTRLSVSTNNSAFVAMVTGGGSGRWRVELRAAVDAPPGTRGELSASLESPGIWRVQSERPRPLIVRPPDPPYEGNDPPTHFRLHARHGAMHVRQGGARIGIETDALDTLFSHAELAINAPTGVTFRGHGNPRRGEIRVNLDVPENAVLGPAGELSASLVLSNGVRYSDSAMLVIDEKAGSRGTFQELMAPQYRIIDVRQFPANESGRSWDSMDEVLFLDRGWSGNDVAAYTINESTTDDSDERELVFYLNADNTELRNAERRMAERFQETTVEAARQHHRTLLCYHMYLMARRDVLDAPTEASVDNSESEAAPYERYKLEMTRTNTTLLYAQREFQELLEDETAGENE